MLTSNSLAGHVALVTGSGRNIGRAIAIELAASGAAVVINGHRDKKAIEGVAEEIRSAGGQAIACLADVSDRTSVNDMVATAIKQFGKVDITISNVGMRRSSPFLEMTEEQWTETLRTNLYACFFLDQATLPAMVAQKWGRIIHITGGVSFFGYATDRAHSMTAKAGAHGLTRGLAREFGPTGVTANTISPGFFDTERDESQYQKHHGPRGTGMMDIAVGRRGKPAEIAYTCRFLASDEGAFINGQVLHVNGGQFMS